MPHTKDGPPSLAAQFISLWSYLSILLAGSFVFLPRSSTKLFGDDRRARQITSADRPEHPFLTPLTADPTATMLSDVTGMLICMMWWGGYVKRWMNPSASTNKSTAITQAMRNERMKAFGVRVAETSIATIATTVMLTPVLILLGAPIDSHIVGTILLALHLGILTTWPLVYALGIPPVSSLPQHYRAKRLLCDWRAESLIESVLLYPLLGTLLGAWASVAVFPLDWDRPWQAYPLAPAAGSLMGFIFGGYVAWALES